MVGSRFALSMNHIPIVLFTLHGQNAFSLHNSLFKIVLIYAVVDLTLIDLPGLTKVAVGMYLNCCIHH